MTRLPLSIAITLRCSALVFNSVLFRSIIHFIAGDWLAKVDVRCTGCQHTVSIQILDNAVPFTNLTATHSALVAVTMAKHTEPANPTFLVTLTPRLSFYWQAKPTFVSFAIPVLEVVVSLYLALHLPERNFNIIIYPVCTLSS